MLRFPHDPWTMQLVLTVLTIALVSTLADGHKNSTDAPWPPPPVYTEKAKMARYLAHYTDWGIVSAIFPDVGYVPFGLLQSFADGPLTKSTGVPYFYVADISDMYTCIEHNNTVSLSVSMAEGDYCRNHGLDPEEPPCARLTLTGKMERVTDKSELSFSKQSLFSRHPAMKGWPSGHGWHFYRLKLIGVCLLDFYGGAAHISLDDYFKATPPFQ